MLTNNYLGHEPCPTCGFEDTLRYAGTKEIAIQRCPPVHSFGMEDMAESDFPMYVCHSEECMYDGKPSITVVFEGRDGNLHTEEAIADSEDS